MGHTRSQTPFSFQRPHPRNFKAPSKRRERHTSRFGVSQPRAGEILSGRFARALPPRYCRARVCWQSPVLSSCFFLKKRNELGALVSLEMGKIKTEGIGEVQEFVDVVS